MLTDALPLSYPSLRGGTGFEPVALGFREVSVIVTSGNHVVVSSRISSSAVGVLGSYFRPNRMLAASTEIGSGSNRRLHFGMMLCTAESSRVRKLYISRPMRTVP